MPINPDVELFVVLNQDGTVVFRRWDKTRKSVTTRYLFMAGLKKLPEGWSVRPSREVFKKADKQ